MNSKFHESKQIKKSALTLLMAASLACAGVVLTGCETTGASASKEVAAPTVVKGMTGDKVLAIMGEPLKVETIEKDGVSAEVWHYEKEVILSSTIESDGEQERVYNDHKTGQLVTVREPIWRNESVRGKLVAEILMVEGKVAAFKERKEATDIEVGH